MDSLSKYSIISYLNNSVSEEKIAIGLIIYSDNNFILQKSDSKIAIACYINKEHSYFIKSSFRSLFERLDYSFKDTSVDDIEKEIIRLHQYEQGIIQVSFPKIMNAPLTQELFNTYFDKWIENKKDN